MKNISLCLFSLIFMFSVYVPAGIGQNGGNVEVNNDLFIVIKEVVYALEDVNADISHEDAEKLLNSIFLHVNIAMNETDINYSDDFLLIFKSSVFFHCYNFIKKHSENFNEENHDFLLNLLSRQFDNETILLRFLDLLLKEIKNSEGCGNQTDLMLAYYEQKISTIIENKDFSMIADFNVDELLNDLQPHSGPCVNIISRFLRFIDPYVKNPEVLKSLTNSNLE